MSSIWADDFDLARERAEDLRRDDVAPADEQRDEEQPEVDRP